MSIQHTFLTIAFLAASMAVIVHVTSHTPNPDNTTVNKRDRDPSQATADQQKKTIRAIVN
jgi:hypothetical protein